MQEKPNPYCWQPLELDKLPKEKQCGLCQQPMHLIPLNEHIAFWVHRGIELQKCTVIAFRTSFLQNLRALLEEKKAHLNEQITEKQTCEKTV